MEEMMVPRGDLMYVRPFVEEFEGKLLMPERSKQTLTYGEVLAVGPKVSPDIKAGTLVYFSNWAGVKFEKDNPRGIIQLRDNEITSIKDDVNGIKVTIGKIGFSREK